MKKIKQALIGGNFSKLEKEGLSLCLKGGMKLKEEKKTEEGRRQYFIKASNRINIPKELQKIIKTPAIYILNFFPTTGEIVLTPYGQKNEK